MTQPPIARLEELLVVLTGDDSEDAAAAAAIIQKEATPPWLPRLHEVLINGEDFWIREAVARPIAEMQGIAALPDLLRAYRLGLEEGHDNDSLTGIICDLVEESADEALQMLTQFSTSSHSVDRIHAAWLLDFVKKDEAVTILGRLLHDENAEVMQTALRALASKETPKVAALIRGLPWTTRFKYRKLLRNSH